MIALFLCDSEGGIESFLGGFEEKPTNMFYNRLVLLRAHGEFHE
jgi:hypothetical protein